MAYESPEKEIFGTALEEYEFTKDQLTKMINWASPSGGSKDTIRAPWLDGDVNAAQELSEYRNYLLQFLSSPQVLALPSGFKIHAGYLNRKQQKAYFSLKAWLNQPKVASSITKGHVKKLLDEWTQIKDKLKMTPKDKELLDFATAALTKVINTPPIDEKTALNPAYNNFSDEDWKHLAALTNAIEYARKTDYYKETLKDFQETRKKQILKQQMKEREKQEKQRLEELREKEKQEKLKKEEAERKARFKALGIEPEAEQKTGSAPEKGETVESTAKPFDNTDVFSSEEAAKFAKGADPNANPYIPDVFNKEPVQPAEVGKPIDIKLFK